MYLQLIVSSVLVSFIDASDVQNSSEDDTESKAAIASKRAMSSYHLWNQHQWKPHKGASPYNITYVDKAENMIRLPEMKNYYEEKKNKKKSFKKSPRRTIQKIIKKNSKSKLKKLYVDRITSKPTVLPKYDIENDYDSRNAEMTTRPNQHKKTRKYGGKQGKLPRYPLPYKQMQRKNTYNKRPKRETQDMFIFKDFDSMEVVEQGKKDEDHYNVVNAHFKKYW